MNPVRTLFTDLHFADGQPGWLAVADGRFVGVGRTGDVPPPADETVELGGKLVLPGLVDGHIHLDKSFLGERWRPHRAAASLRERLAIEKRLLAEAAPIAQRASALIERALGHGTIFMRSHVDVDATTGLAHLHEVMAVRERYRDQLDIQLVAFPQAGVLSCPGTVEVLREALEEGVDAIGGIDPAGMDGDCDGQLDAIFGLAERHAARIDIHLHDAGQCGIDQLLAIAERTRVLGLGGRVAVSHAYALGDVPADVLADTAARLAGAGVAIMTNAPGDRAFPPVLALRAAGVTVFSGNDNIRDAWWPYGSADMLERAMLVGYRSGFYSDDELGVALSMATDAAAAALGIADYGLRPGARADFIALDAQNGAEAVVALPCPREVYRGGVRLR